MKLKNIEQLNIQGYQCLLEGKSKKAQDYFHQALEIEPNNPVLLNNLGNTLFNLKAYDKSDEEGSSVLLKFLKSLYQLACILPMKRNY